MRESLFTFSAEVQRKNFPGHMEMMFLGRLLTLQTEESFVGNKDELLETLKVRI